jgi:hypothetical protein
VLPSSQIKQTFDYFGQILISLAFSQIKREEIGFQDGLTIAGFVLKYTFKISLLTRNIIPIKYIGITFTI